MKNASSSRGHLRAAVALLLPAATAFAAPACSVQTLEEPTDSSEQRLQVGDDAGWVFFDGTAVLQARSFNSSGGDNHVTNVGLGAYEVEFEGLSGGGGNVQVTAAGAGSERCKVAGWSSTGMGLRADVRCHTAAGAPVNTKFIASFARFPGGTAVSSSGAYVWMNQPTGGVLSSGYQWGAPASVAWNGTGQYTVTLAGQASGGGSVLVTAYGTGAEYCKTQSWFVSGSDTHINVRCFSAGGAPVNTQFSLRYLLETRDSEGGSGGFVWANDATATDYTPASNYQFHEIAGCGTSGQDNTAHRITAGRYQITYPDLGGGGAGFPTGAALVTAYGSGSEYCKITTWEVLSSEEAIRVGTRCFNASGALVDTQFTQVYFSEIVIPC